MDATDLTALTAAEIVARVHDGRTSAVAVAEAHLARIAARDGHIGAFQEHDPERVLAEAGAVDRRADRFALPLAGVPVAIKDCVDVAGYPTRHGSAATATEPAQPGRRAGQAAARGRGGRDRQDPHARARDLGLHPLRARHARRNPLDPRARPRRLQRRQRPRPWRPGWPRSRWAPTAAARSASRRRTAGWSGSSPAAASFRCRAGRTSTGAGCRSAGPLARTAEDAALMLGVLAGRTFASTSQGRCTWRCRCGPRCRSRRLHPDHRAAAVGAAARLRAAPGGAAVTLADPPYPRTLGLHVERRWHAGRRPRRADLGARPLRRRAAHGRGGAARAPGAAVRRAAARPAR